ncbi:antitoxin VbhA family protein [Desulfococcaceae bacterium OttesenSCG-928-F15]|nr:antitoxin VbhA family protein [Desulfococcaceae bacterium OttesenSCG-928-F15]
MKKIEFTMTEEELKGFTHEEIAWIRWSIEEAIASARLEGAPEPTPDQIRDQELAAFGKITHEEFVQRALKRAMGV